MANDPNGKFSLLLAEDSDAEVQILKRSLRDSGRPIELHVVRDGQEALDYLLAAQAKSCLPQLVLLDLNLPKLSGTDVLNQLRKHRDLRSLPVVIWTTSQKPEDIQQAYASGANSYIEKPRDYERFRTVLDSILRYWFDTVLLP